MFIVVIDLLSFPCDVQTSNYYVGANRKNPFLPIRGKLNNLSTAWPSSARHLRDMILLTGDWSEQNDNSCVYITSCSPNKKFAFGSCFVF